MKKLHSFVFYALVTPGIAMGTSSVLAQQSNDRDIDRQQQSPQREQGATPSAPRTQGADQNTQHTKPSDSQKAAGHRNMRDGPHMQNRGYINVIPAKGTQASNLIGAEVKTTGDEDIGSVNDLIIDENGQVVAIVVSVGGIMGMGEKEVAIGWGNVTRSGTSDKQELRVDVTRKDLDSAPEFKIRK